MTFARGPSATPCSAAALRWLDGPQAGLDDASDRSVDGAGLMLDVALDPALAPGTPRAAARRLRPHACDLRRALRQCGQFPGRAVPARQRPAHPLSDGELVNGRRAALARAARALVGARFRLHGRDPATGLDCVGLVAAALAAMGRRVPAPAGYALRNRDIAGALAFAAARGSARSRRCDPRPATCCSSRSGPAQHHLRDRGRGGASSMPMPACGAWSRRPAPLPLADRCATGACRPTAGN